MDDKSYSEVENETSELFIHRLSHFPIKYNRRYLSTLDTHKTVFRCADMRIPVV